jgi:hypothetical protein
MSGRWIFSGVALAIVPCLALLAAVMSVGAQETPEPTATQAIDSGLAAPSDARYVVRPEGRFFTWRDNATDEDGYRLEITIVDETRNFQTAADVTEFRVPDDFTGGCGGIFAAVRAFRDGEESEPANAGLAVTCPPVATSTSGPILPDSGNGPTADGGSIPYFAVAVLGIVSLLALVGSTALRRRKA